MDDQRFDDLARALATGTSRRGLLGGVAGGAFVAALALVAGGRTARAAGGGSVGVCLRTGNDVRPYVSVRIGARAAQILAARGRLLTCEESTPPDLETCSCGGAPQFCTPGDDTTCEGGAECCPVHNHAGETTCIPKGFQCAQKTCAADGNPCVYDSECCDGTCEDGVCHNATGGGCQPEFGHCETSEDCCAGECYVYSQGGIEQGYCRG